MAVVLAVAAVVCWLGKPGASPIAPSSAAPPTAARVAVGAALIEQSPTARPLGSEAVTGSSGEAYYARAIETIQTGQRVLARNPELAGGELPDAPVDPATWVNIRLRMPKPTGDFLEITLLRLVEWLAEHLAQTTSLDGEYPRALVESRGTDSTSGSTTVTSVMPTVYPPELSPGMIEPITADSSTGSPWIFLTLHELEAVGPAEIVEVGPCPELEPGEGRLVTGTFAHQSGEVFDITVVGLTEPIGCTGAHPFWSEDRHEFIPARALRPGETLRTESGTLRQITRITPRRGPPVPVFNLEVDAEHVYYVSVVGVLVHIAYDLESQSLGKYRGGAHSEMTSISKRGDGLDSHHMPDRYADPSTTSLDGPAIQMDPSDHHATSSNGRHGTAAARYRAKTAEMIANGRYRDAMAREIRDVRRAASVVSGDVTKYNQAIREMLEYARRSGQLPGK
ncbi:MAG: polymorphic toxin-type HINT domain-containing protein [Planctomycetaceae bacterium]